MNFIKRLGSKMYAGSFLMAQLPFASAGLFLDIAHAHPSETSAVEDSSIQSQLDILNDETDTTLERSTLSLKVDAEPPQSSIHSLLEPLASLSENLSKFPLLQPYRSDHGNLESQETVAGLFPLSANYLPTQRPAKKILGKEENESEVGVSSNWQSRSNYTLKQWRQPSIQVVSVDVKNIGRSLHSDRPLKGLKKAIASAIPGKTVPESFSPKWNAFCFATTPPQPDSKTLKKVHQLMINDQIVAEFSTLSQANLMAKRLRSWIQEKMFSPSDLVAKIRENKVLGLSKDQVLFEVDNAISQLLGQNRDTIAIAWVNNLRTALNVNPLNLVDAQIQLYELRGTSETMDGTASWYGPYFHGRQTASGEYFHEGELTVAHKSLPFDTYLKVTNLENDQSVVVRVNDRGPYIGERSLDLSRNAAQCLGSEDDGVIPYHAVIMKQAS